MKRTLLFAVVAAAVTVFNAPQASAQSKLKNILKKVEKAVSDSGSSNDTSAEDQSRGKSSPASSDDKRPVITTPAKTITVDFYDAEPNENDLYIDFTLRNSGEPLNAYWLILESIKDSKGRAYSASFSVSGDKADFNKIVKPLGTDDAVYVEMRIKGAANETVNIQFSCYNGGVGTTDKADGKLNLKGVQATK